jgi:hypothetical protein
VGRIMHRQRAHTKPLFGNFRGPVHVVIGEICQYFIDGRQMVAHIRQHMMLHHFGKLNQLSRIIAGTGACAW